ncbi:response regulator transcription factor [Kitasatospora sp. NBC_00374]|uniref:response regulator n=1 Tax=Kitasatospora sp. NBC_00374 TaxID=2975964 RepID=UPI0030DF1EE6
MSTARPDEQTITVLIADDHPVVREGLSAMLESAPGIMVAGTAGGGEEAVVLAAALAPDVVLMDLRMGAMDGVTATARILAHSRRPRVVVVTTYESDADILRAVEAGAAGYLLKGTSRVDLINAVRAAARGETVLSPAVAGRLFRARAHEPQPLSAREREVLQLVGRGLTNADIGRELHIGEATVKTHLLRIFRKLDVSDRTAAVLAAMERGLLD